MTDNPTNGVPTPESPAPDKGEEKTFTQAQLDSIIKQRLDERKSKYADYDELKAAAEKLKTIEEAQKSETQKLQERLAMLEKQAIDAIAGRTEATIRAAALVELGKVVPADRVSAAYKLLDKSTLKLGEGESITGLPEAITAMLAENAFLKDAKQPDAPPQKDEPKIRTLNPSGTNPQGSDIKSWHPLHRHRDGGGFTGNLIQPLGEGKK